MNKRALPNLLSVSVMREVPLAGVRRLLKEASWQGGEKMCSVSQLVMGGVGRDSWRTDKYENELFNS